MDFDFTAEQDALRDAVRRWVDKGFGFERRQKIVRAGGAAREVYAELVDLGLAGLVVEPEHGGLGCGAVDAMVVMEELGRGLVNAPYAQAALVAPALLAAAAEAVRSAWLPRIADGSALIVLAHQERGARWRRAHVATRAVPSGGAWAIDGAKSLVPAGDEADAFVVPARTAGSVDDADGIGLFLVERSAAGLNRRGYPTHDGARAAELAFAATPATRLVEDGLAVLERSVDIARAALFAEAVGAMDRLVDITVEYMNTRRQFGATLASFQALRHRIADVKMQLELARSMSWFATLKLGEPDAARRYAVALARVQLGEAMRFVGQQCVQLHGGIGITDEVAAAHYFKRLTMIELAFGDTLHALAEVSSGMQDTAGVFA